MPKTSPLTLLSPALWLLLAPSCSAPASAPQASPAAAYQALDEAYQTRLVELYQGEPGGVADAQRVEERLATPATEIFGSRPELVQAEARRRYALLPLFPAAGLEGYTKRTDLAPFPLPARFPDFEWVMQAWIPERLAGLAAQMTTANELTVEDFARRAMFASQAEVELFRTGDAAAPDLVARSLGELFVIELDWTKEQGCYPRSVQWWVPGSPAGEL